MSTTPPGARRRVPVPAVLLALSTALALAVVLAGGATPAPAQAPSVERRVQDLLAQMSLAEKVGQMGQINLSVLQGDPNNPWDRGPLNPDQLELVLDTHQIGSILSGGGAWPSPPGNDGRTWAEQINTIQEYAVEHQRHGIPIIYGVDAVHGHSNLSDATMFPHQIGLGASFDTPLVRRLGRRTADAVRVTGVHWNFSPVLDTQRDLRWGRSYEPFSEDPFLNGVLGTAMIRGLEYAGNPYGRVAATAKHFVGYSAPDSGRDRSDATISEAELQDLHLPPFETAIDAGVDTVMVNSGSVNGEPVHASRHLLTEVLRGQLGFQGVVVTDWQDIENLITKYRVAADMKEAVALAINAGIDMSMIPLDAPGFTTAVREAVADGMISRRRIDQSVARILRLKFRLGLFEDPYGDAEQANEVIEDPADLPLSRRAARESLVLLENRGGTLPLGAGAGRILVTGPASDSPTYQFGGWTVGWQGAFNLPADVTIPPATTIREGIEAAAPAGATVTWSQGVPPGDTTMGSTDPANDPDAADTRAAIDAAVEAAGDADTIVVAVGESPYAEGRGDLVPPALRASQRALVDELVATGKPVVMVVVAGRPLEMDDQLAGADASLMAFWPGTEGGTAVADVLFGAFSPSGRLPVSWPRNGATYPLAHNEPGDYDPRYAFGRGLQYERFVVDRLSAPQEVDDDATVTVRARLTNAGDQRAEHVVLATVERLEDSDTAAPRQLVGFDRVALPAGGQTRVRLDFDVFQLATTPADGGYRRVEPGTYRLRVDGATIEFDVG